MKALKITNNITRRTEKSIDKYLNEIRNYDVLTPEEELELFQRLRAGEEGVLEKIVLHNLRFVISVAKQYQDVGLTLVDLINEGNIGLIKAAHRFDESKGFKFISYAVWWIRQSMLKAINEKGNAIKIPSHITKYSGAVRRAKSDILQREEREATISELVAATDLTADQIERYLVTNKNITSLDAPFDPSEDYSLVDHLPDSHIAPPDEALVQQESIQIQVKDLLDSLPQRQAEVLIMYFGINGNNPMTLNEISEYMGISRERVRQIKERSLIKLRRRMRA